MKTEVIKETLNKYIDNNLYDVDGLFEYIKYKTNVELSSLHTFVRKVNVPFLKRNYGLRENPYFEATNWFDDSDEIDIDLFLRRVPFFFHLYSNKERGLTSNFGTLLLCFHSGFLQNEEDFYHILDKLHYSFDISLDNIFGYVLNQFGNLDSFNDYLIWYEYASIIHESHQTDYTPKNLLWSFNKILSERGKEVRRYSIDSWKRTDREIIVSGNLPFNPETNELEPSWILLWINNASKIYVEKGNSSDLRINVHIALQPDTFVYQYIDDTWEQLYVGPTEMYFDLEAIRSKRKELKYTQDEVANIIGVSVRSYRYFEEGRYVPNGLQLIRLMNLLNFNDFEALIYKENIKDPELSKFLSGQEILSFLKARY